MSITLDNPLPVAVDAERSILGSILLDPQHLLSARSALHAEQFSLEAHRHIFRAMCLLEDAGSTIDYATMRHELSMAKRLEAVGGVAYLASLTELLPRRLDIDSHIELVREKAALRNLAQMALQAATMATDGSYPSAEVIGSVQGDLERILEGSVEVEEPLIGNTIIRTFDEIRRMRREPVDRGMSFGITSLDEFTNGGMRPGEVTIVGARSGVGKSSLMCQTAVANAQKGIPVHLFSLEMTRTQIEHRILSIVSKVPFRHIDKCLLTDDEEHRLFQSTEQITDWPMRIHDKSEMHIDKIVGLARLSIRRFGTRLIFVDYAQNVTADGKDERTRVGSVSQKLTTMIKHEPAALMLLSQLRKVDREHYSKPPIILDLLETGKLEQNAHLVLLLHRGYDEQADRISDDAEIIVAKQRRGDTGALQYRFSRRTVVFEER